MFREYRYFLIFIIEIFEVEYLFLKPWVFSLCWTRWSPFVLILDWEVTSWRSTHERRESSSDRCKIDVKGNVELIRWHDIERSVQGRWRVEKKQGKKSFNDSRSHFNIGKLLHKFYCRINSLQNGNSRWLSKEEPSVSLSSLNENPLRT